MKMKTITNLVKYLDEKRIDTRRYETVEDFVPARILRSVVMGVGFIDVMSDTQSNVWIHPGHSVVLH